MSTIVIPTLRFSERAVLDRCIEAFGLEIVDLYVGETEDQVEHAELRLGDAWIMCGTIREEGLSMATGGASLYFIVDTPDEVDAMHERALSAGIASAREPKDEEYGGRGCTLQDADGNYWSFGTYRPSGL